ncbi:unnamed protein product [Prorocentrum cordatum]|uniref:Phosphoglycerate kinase n=1 Tax=Prorocentrum cordatum TaxID=2364126 RepID=A0ABN9PAT5_9DINO|nr:unnamed protein product [Polarella glacialis]
MTLSSCICSPTSGVFAARYISREHPSAQRVYVIGGQGLVDELRRVGIESSGGPAEDAETFEDTRLAALAATVAAEHYDGVVVGWDTALNYGLPNLNLLVARFARGSRGMTRAWAPVARALRTP